MRWMHASDGSSVLAAHYTRVCKCVAQVGGQNMPQRLRESPWRREEWWRKLVCQEVTLEMGSLRVTARLVARGRVRAASRCAP